MKLAIVGAGVVGRCLALAASRRGYQVDVYDAGAETACSAVAAGLLAPYCELATAPPVVHRLGRESLPIWEAFAAECDGAFYFQRAGTLVVAAAGDRGELTLLARRTGASDRRAVAAEYEPELAGRFHEAVYFSGEGQLDPGACLASLRRAAIARGARWRDRARALGAHFVDDSRYDEVADCRGLEARSDWRELRGVRGEIARVHAPEVRLSRPVRLIHPRFALYVAPRPGQHYVIGATVLESEATGPVGVRSVLELLSAAYALHPGFGEASIENLAAHRRPALPDNAPRLQRRAGLLRINGLYRHGYLISPRLCEIALAVLEGDPACELVTYSTLSEPSFVAPIGPVAKQVAH